MQKTAIFRLAALTLTIWLGWTTSAAAFSTLCDGDCSLLGDADRGDGTRFDFDLGIAADADDRKIQIKTRGNVYLVGPISTRKLARLKASSILLDGDLDHTGRLKLKTRNLISDFMPAEMLLDDAISNPKTRVKSSRNKLKITSRGDLYLDVAGIDLKLLKIKARGSILLSGHAPGAGTPIPEPTTALLMALGLAGLSIRPPRRSGRLG